MNGSGYRCNFATNGLGSTEIDNLVLKQVQHGAMHCRCIENEAVGDNRVVHT